MKYSFFFSLLTFLFFSCTDNTKTVNVDSLRIDSALKSQTATIIPSTIKSNDTVHVTALPQVMEGDLIFQNSDDVQSLAFGKATKSKYNNVGLIYLRAKDQLYMVFDTKDSVHSIPLTEWVDQGNGQHIAILRLKNSNIILNAEKTKKMKMAARSITKKKYDPYFSWSDEAFYSSEMIYKLYKVGASVEICSPEKLSQLDLSDALVKQQMKNKYGASIPKDEQVVTPDDLYKSPKLEIIYEK